MYSNVIWTEDQTMGRWICRPQTSHTGRLVFLQTLHLDCLHSLLLFSTYSPMLLSHRLYGSS